MRNIIWKACFAQPPGLDFLRLRVLRLSGILQERELLPLRAETIAQPQAILPTDTYARSSSSVENSYTRTQPIEQYHTPTTPNSLL